jgi:hypothetical protein
MTDWSKLKVTELKDELKSRGIALTGLKLKADYVAKLEEIQIPDANDASEGPATEAAPNDEPVDSEQESEIPIDEARDEDAVTKNDAPEDNLHNGKVEENMTDAGSDDRPADVILPEQIDMYSTSQLKPTPSQPLTEILAAKEEAKTEAQNPATPPSAAVDVSNVSTPVPATELVEDSKKRKRRSATPPPSTQEVALKKAKARDGTPIITKQESALEQIQAATDAAEAIRAPDGLGENAPIKDVPGLRGKADTKPSQSRENATGNEQAALRSASPERQAHTPSAHSDRNVPPAIHSATRSLYLRDFKRPLQVSMLRAHLTEIAQSPSKPSADDPITVFHLDSIRTHALVTFDSVTTAARVRSAMHQTIFPNEASRTPIWVDFIPDEEVEPWISKETSNSDRNKKWEVVYVDSDGVSAVHQEVDAAGPSQRPSISKPREISISEAPSQPRGSIASDFHPERAKLVPAPKRDSYDRGLPSRPDHKPDVIPTSETGTGFKALDELFSSTTTKPKLYYKPVSATIAEDRLEMIKDLRVTHSEMGKSGDEGMKRYSFEVYKGREEWVDKGPEFGYGRRGVEVLSGRRGRGGGYRGGRGDSRGRGGDSWRGRY